MSLPISIPEYLEEAMGTVRGMLSEPIGLWLANSVTGPPVPGFGSSASKTIRTVMSPAGSVSVPACIVTTPGKEHV